VRELLAGAAGTPRRSEERSRAAKRPRPAPADRAAAPARATPA
jgi:hypothetical protein